MTAPTIRGLLRRDGVLDTTVTVRGLWNGTSMLPVTMRDLTGNSVVDPGGGGGGGGGGGVGTMLYGVSGTASPFNATYTQQVRDLHAKGAYMYDPGGSVNWSQVSAMPTDHPLMLQTKDETLAGHQALLASMPATRKAPVWLHWDNEIDRKIKTGAYAQKGGGTAANPLTQAQQMAWWNGQCDQLYQAIADSGKSYVIPTVQLQYQVLQFFNQGKTELFSNPGNFLRPGVQHINWSAYALDTATPDGLHRTFKYSPIAVPAAIGKYMNTIHPELNFGITAGWGFPAAKWQTDPISQNNRANWMKTHSLNMAKAGAKFYGWFDITYGGLYYKIEDDPILLAAWKELLTASGQW